MKVFLKEFLWLWLIISSGLIFISVVNIFRVDWGIMMSWSLVLFLVVCIIKLRR